MDSKTIQEIFNINRYFYESYAKEFSLTRQTPWKGWSKITEYLPNKNLNILDVGCGNGRFYKFLTDVIKDRVEYLGVDVSISLIDDAKKSYPNTTFLHEDFIVKNSAYNKRFNAVVGFGILHHIPSEDLRIKFILDMHGYVASGGVLILTFWKEKPSENKVKANANLNLDTNDYLVEWDKDVNKYRYVHVFDRAEIEQIKLQTSKLGLKLISEFSADGKNGNSNIYLVWRKTANYD